MEPTFQEELRALRMLLTITIPMLMLVWGIIHFHGEREARLAESSVPVSVSVVSSDQIAIRRD